MDHHAKLSMSLVVPRLKVKTVKNALEAHDLLDKRVKITPLPQGELFRISLKISSGNVSQGRNETSQGSTFQSICSLGLEGYLEDITLFSSGAPTYDEPADGANLLHTWGHSTTNDGRNKPLDTNIDAWLKSIPASMHREVSGSHTTSSYTVYPPMLLLPPTALSRYLGDDKFSNQLPRLYKSLCEAFKTSHIALNGPISASSSGESVQDSILESQSATIPNILRSPTGLTPLFGDFGPALPAGHTPIAADFEAAFWCTSKQNAIFQTWAPRYAMFSRGNISEKARIQRLASSACQNNPKGPCASYVSEQSTAVDLYAGIGYFAFSYAKAGVAKVLCWEINPWSVKGLEKGARVNRWSTRTFHRAEDDNAVLENAMEKEHRIFIFEENNENAINRIKRIRDLIPPIRQVNCGYLPSSKDSWKTAVAALDPREGGWIHAHENIAKRDIEQRKCEIVNTFTDLVKEVHGPDDVINRLVSCEHLERVKSYAPGVIHCVLDIAVSSFLAE